MAEKEVRTQIYLERWQHEALKQKAAEESVSMAHLVREAVTAYLAQRDAEEEHFDWEAYKNDPIWEIPEIARELGPSGITDGSVNHDTYIYDLDKPYNVDESDE